MCQDKGTRHAAGRPISQWARYGCAGRARAVSVSPKLFDLLLIDSAYPVLRNLAPYRPSAVSSESLPQTQKSQEKSADHKHPATDSRLKTAPDSGKILQRYKSGTRRREGQTE